MTKQELRQYTRLNIELQRLGEKIDTLESKIISPKIPQLSDMPRGGERLDMADHVAKLIDLKNLYCAKWDELIAEQKKIEKAIATLADPVERALIGYKYIDGLTWEEVAEKINYSWQWTHKLHGKALVNINR